MEANEKSVQELQKRLDNLEEVVYAAMHDPLYTFPYQAGDAWSFNILRLFKAIQRVLRRLDQIEARLDGDFERPLPKWNGKLELDEDKGKKKLTWWDKLCGRGDD